MLKSRAFHLVLIFAILPAIALGQDQPSPTALLQFVRDSRKAGLDDGKIQQNAVKAGWPPASVTEAFANLARAAGQTSEPASTKTEPIALWDVGRTSASPNAMALPPSGADPVRPAKEASGSVATPPPVNRGVSDDYRIGEGDDLQVNVYGEPTASVNNVVVRPDGKISIPLIKEVRVAGLTPVELEKLITDRLSKIIKSPDVTIVVSQVNSKKVFLTGGVKKEGPVDFANGLTVMQAIVEAGGLTDYAKRKKIYVLHTENGIQYQLPFDYDAVKKGERVELNVLLQPGDTIVVPH